MKLKRILGLATVFLLGMAGCQRQAVPETGAQLSVEGSAYVLKLPDGRVLKGRKLQGVTLHLALEGGALASVLIRSVVPDPDYPDILRHQFEIADGLGGMKPACAPNAYGETWGFPITLPAGHPGRDGEVGMTCASGAVGKCARFGYRPWAKGPKGEDLVPYHAACVHMVRGDYCGDGLAHTRDGTSIDIYDDLGIQKPGTMDDSSYLFEAGWTPGGAACVAHTRWNDLLTLEQLAATCPRLNNARACTELRAQSLGARLFNRSRRLPAATAP